ncbi:DNA adenine methylase [Nakamurella sp. UYEF19]|uniref:DNA adenine methylase n=1 Tax=Nakamurella sp. UYEF19 TaxID=1756392 RepID=UPI003393A37C
MTVDASDGSTSDGVLLPPFAYFGGKVRVAAQIVRLLPDHEHYVEPFCGGLSVLLAKSPVLFETVNDLDGDLMLFWRMLRDFPADLERVCALTPHSRGEYMSAAGPGDGCDDLERARRVWIRLSQGRAGGQRGAGWRHHVDPGGSTQGMPGRLAGYASRIGDVAARLGNVSLECMPAVELIGKYGAEPKALLYCDPPYLGSTRTSQNNTYRTEMRGPGQHRVLAEAVTSCAAAVVVSGYSSPLYDRLYAGWWRREIASATGQGSVWAARTEVLWSNRPFRDDTAQPGLFGSDEAGPGR